MANHLNACTNCHFCSDESEYGDFGSVYYVAYSCAHKNIHSDDDESFPYAVAPDCFVPDFWYSTLAEQLDGSPESLDAAVREWTKRYLSEKSGK